MKICILYGGVSSEREVSLNTGKSIYDAICDDYDVVMHDFDGDYQSMYDAVKDVDLVFIALHGGDGEDGTIQKYLESKNIKFTGSSSVASKKAMDKHLAKLLCVKHDISTPKWKVVDVRVMKLYGASRGLYIANLCGYLFVPYDDEYELNIGSVTGGPVKGANGVVVKPCKEGSSVGISIIGPLSNDNNIMLDNGNDLELIDAIKKTSKISEYYFMIEEFIDGRELTVSILDNKVLPIVEIIPKGDYYDYECKYTKFQSNYIVPAKINQKTQELLSAYSLKIHKLIGCGAYSRVDFRLSKDDEIYFLEINTLPGFTDTSLFPKATAACGLGYRQLIKKIIEIT